MTSEFIAAYVKLLVVQPDSVRVEITNSTDECDEMVIFVHSDDIGKVIGKDGKMISAIKTFISGCKAKGGKNYHISVKTEN